MKKKNNKKSRNKKKTIKLTNNDTCSLDNADTEKLLSKSLFEKAVKKKRHWADSLPSIWKR